MALWGLLAATEGAWARVCALVGSLVRTNASRTAAELSVLDIDKRLRALQGLSVLALGYLLALVSQVWLMHID